MTQIANRKTAGVLGDELALNARQATAVRADRELLVVWAVDKGSLRNKAILGPAALEEHARSRHPAGSTLVDEDLVGAWHRGHVPGRRRHPGAWRSDARPCAGGFGRAAPLGWAAPVVSNLGNALAGMAAGLVVVGAVTLAKRLRAGSAANAS
jgi:hypothetical protein